MGNKTHSPTSQSDATDFSQLCLKPGLLENLDSLGFAQMTPVQAQCLPAILAGADVIAQAQTGSGKTAAFGLGLLNKLEVKRFRIQSLVLCPTRELADQVAKEIRRLARAIHNIKVLTLCGGMPFGPQIGSLEHGAHIIVGTPGRIEEHVRKGTLKLDNVNMLVLDEADRMLDMGFQAALDAITAKVPSARQTLLLSATYPDQIQFMAANLMREPIMVQVQSERSEPSINQFFCHLSHEDQRQQALQLLLLEQSWQSCVVFCNTKRETQELAQTLGALGFSALALHGDLEQRDRDQALVQFANLSVSLLVATDVAARGIDVDSVDLVINFHVVKDPEVHVHRVGRTGRAGRSGYAFTLYSDKEQHRLQRLQEFLAMELNYRDLPAQTILQRQPQPSAMRTIQIAGGKKQKVRAGDILGALTRDGNDSLTGSDVGKIQLFDQIAFVAVTRAKAKLALNKITQGKMKGRQFKARLLK